MLSNVAHHQDSMLPPAMWMWEDDQYYQKTHTWTRRNKHSNLISTLLQCVVPLPCVLSPAQTELTDLLSSIWSGFDLLRIWRWKDIIFEFRPQGEVIAPTSQRAHRAWAPAVNFRTSRHCQTSTSCHHLSGNHQNHGWIMAFRYFFLAQSCAICGGIVLT